MTARGRVHPDRPYRAVEIDGLTESIRALHAFDARLGTEAKTLLRDGAKLVHRVALRRMSRRPGGGTYPRRRKMIAVTATQAGAGVKLRAGSHPWAYGAEYGAVTAWLWGHPRPQALLARRTFPPWRGNQFVAAPGPGPGWLIQPAIRRLGPRISRDIGDGINGLLSSALTRAGVPRSR